MPRSRFVCLLVLAAFLAPGAYVGARAAVLPDLVVTSIGAPSSVLAGSTITVRTTVKNLQGRAGSSYLRVVLSRDTLVGSTDKVLGKRFVPALAAGATSTGSKTWTIPATTAGGAWYLVACADATKLVREAREGNNCRARAITVTRPNRPPVAVADELATEEDGKLMVGVGQLLGNDSDPDGNPLSVTAVSNPVNGNVSLDGSTVTFEPTQHFSGAAGFNYTLADGKGASVQGSVAVMVFPVNDPPLAADDVALTAQDTTVVIPYADLLANDSDVDEGAALGVTAVSDAVNGAVSLDPVNELVSFTPTNGFYGTAWFLYTVSDGEEQDVGKVEVTVTPGPLGYVLSHESPTVTEGTYTSVWVSLTRAPEGDVVVTPSSVDQRLWLPDPEPLTFTPSTWSTPQQVTVYAEHDDDLEDGVGVIWLEAPGITTAQTGWNIDDDDTQAIDVSPTSVTVNEGGSTSFGVRLAFRPSADVTVTVGSGDTSAVSLGTSQLTFTPQSWNAVQNATVTGVQDVDVTAEAVTVQVASSGLPTRFVSVTVNDDDTQAVQTTPASLTVREGSSSTVQVNLAFQPAANVTVTLWSSDTSAVTFLPASLTFTTGNWNVPQTVTLTGQQDVDVVSEAVTVTLSATGATGASVAVTAFDNDLLFAAPSSQVIVEGGQGELDLNLRAQPPASVTVICEPSDPLVVVSPPSRTFTPENWSTYQTMVLQTGEDDDLQNNHVNVECRATGQTSVMLDVLVTEPPPP